ncbi:putative baseplate assembly protein [Bradyrhizobium sp. cf659]|uniref:putative baseplate assembly protein n=1 Tax=Bradyrhizobium sp. cf659 TaxID=1761771 RepID=UPI0008E741C9|nr:putative baseplate assembly protein [Bradyrhizobium sp. cf659]SFH98614.1 putative baseplate assembly protein [Bradyrhizobium sp. cf659]
MASNSSEFCREPQRRQDIRKGGSTGIDYIEVSDDRLTLTVFFLNRITRPIVPANVAITGGARVRDIKVTGVRLRGPEDADGDNSMEVAIDRPGDGSTYTLSLVDLDDDGEPTDRVLPGIDPRYARANFSFRLDEVSDVDCKQPPAAPKAVLPVPEINYLARDYGSFRQLMLDRLAVTVPAWRENHVPDIGIALVEVLAYVADHLSYYQDAVATETYLGTARQRISVRRHARLVDFAMHEGCNARAFVFVDSGSQDVTIEDPAAILFAAGYDGPRPPQGGPLLLDQMSFGPADRPVIFEPMAEGMIALHAAHNEISFYAWRDRDCCLPAGATSATLRDEWKETAAAEYTTAETQPYEKPRARKRSAKSSTGYAVQSAPPKEPPATHSGERQLNLRPGDILLFEEVKGPETGKAVDANPAHRHFVRLTEVKQGRDPLFDQPVLEITWAREDALPFALRLSNALDPPGESTVSVARGNIILADHGDWTGQGSRIVYEDLSAPVSGKKFRPALHAAPLTFRDPKVDRGAAMKQLLQDPRSAIPQLIVYSIAPRLDGAAPPFTFADLQQPARLAAQLNQAQPDPSRSDQKLSDPEQELAWLNFRDRMSVAAEGPAPIPNDPANAEKSAGALKDKLKSLLRIWTPQRDLLSSRSNDLHFVVEIDNEGVAHLRFGDGRNGKAPEIGENFAATYRVGIGSGGNVGADTITQIVTSSETLHKAAITVRNPLPSTGGTDPESIEKVKLLAAKAFQGELVRAVSADDYARLAERNPRVQRAAAELQWVGTRYEAHVAIDPLGTEEVDPALLRQIRVYLFRFKRIGHDVIVVPPTYVPIDVAMTVQVQSGFATGHVETVLRGIFSDRTLPDGQLGFFHPDNLSFGDSIHASRLMAAAQAVGGVESVIVTRLQRRFQAPDEKLYDGVLPIGPLEIARLGGNSASPENGRFVLTVRGGQ